MHYGLNVRSPALSDPERRAAVAAAVDRAELAGILGRGAIAVGSLSPELVACSSDCGPETSVVDVPALHVDYVAEETGVEAALAERLAAQLSERGIPARARAHDLEDFVLLVVEGRHEVFRTGWVGLAPEYDGLLSPYLSGSPDNRTGLSDRRFDDAMALARRSEDPVAYSDAADALEDAHALVPVARVGYAVALSPELAGLRFGPLGTFDAFDLGSRL